MIRNVFPLVETKGVLLSTIVQGLEDRGWVVDWVDFLQQSLDHGWKPKGTISKIEEALLDIKGPEHTEQVLRRLKELLGLRHAI